MIPEFDGLGNLPPGVHAADWAEVEVRFGQTGHRMNLLRGLKRAALSLKGAGCKWIYIDGSFVSSKQIPDDFDACWDPVGVDTSKLDSTLLTFGSGRALQKVKFGGELFPSTLNATADPPWRTFLDFFQREKMSGQPKGIIMIDLEKPI